MAIYDKGDLPNVQDREKEKADRERDPDGN